MKTTITHNRIFWCILWLFLLLGLPYCTETAPEDPRLEPIRNILDSTLIKNQWPALSLGLVINGQSFEIHKGELLNNKSPSSSTIYEIASLTKTFTGTLLAKALTEGKIELDQDIRLHLKDSFPNLSFQGTAITFRHLVTHQSGLPHLFPHTPGLFDEPDWDQLPYQINQLQEDYSKADFYESLRQFELDTFPGVPFIYSNAGANLVGYLLEEIYQSSFKELLQEKILGPHRMQNTFLDVQDLDTSRMAFGVNTNGKRMPLRAAKDMKADGGLLASVGDMIKYMHLHLDTAKLVTQTAHQELWDGKFGDFEAGLFWQIFKDGDKPDRIFQNGGAYGTSSWITLIPELQIGIFMVTNTAGEGVHEQLSQAVDKIIEVVRSAPGS